MMRLFYPFYSVFQTGNFDTNIGAEELAHLEMAATIVHQLTKDLTTLNVSKKDTGRMAVNILLNRIKHNHNEYLRVELPCKS